MNPDEPLYKVSTAYTLSQYRDYNRTIQRENGLGRKLILSLVMYFGIGLVFAVIMHAWYLCIPFFVIGIVNAYMARKGILRAEMAQYQQEQLVGTVTYEFFQDRVDVSTFNGRTSNSYDSIPSVIENSRAFYLMMSSNSGIILPKEDCPSGLEDFIRQMLPVRKVRDLKNNTKLTISN